MKKRFIILAIFSFSQLNGYTSRYKSKYCPEGQMVRQIAHSCFKTPRNEIKCKYQNICIPNPI